MAEVVVVGPGHRRAVHHRDGLGNEPVGGRQVDHIRGDGLCGSLGRAAGQQQPDSKHRTDDPQGAALHQARLSAAWSLEATPLMAAAKIRMNATRSKTSLSRWANRKIVQSRW